MVPIIELKGVKEAEDIIKRRIQRLDNLRYPLAQIAKDYFNIERRWFSSEGEGTWKPLAQSTIKQKKARGFKTKILQRTGMMKREFSGEEKGGLAITNNTLSVRIRRSPQWELHQRGNGRPKRVVISPVIKSRNQYWSGIVTNWIKG